MKSLALYPHVPSGLAYSFIHSWDLYSTSSRDFYSEVLPFTDKEEGLQRDVKFGTVVHQNGPQLKGEIRYCSTSILSEFLSSNSAHCGVIFFTLFCTWFQFKTKMQIQIIRSKSGEAIQYRNVFHAGYVIGKNYGVRGVFQGLFSRPSTKNSDKNHLYKFSLNCSYETWNKFQVSYVW